MNKKSIISTIGISISWAILAAILGAICWVFILTVIHPLILGESFDELISYSEFRVVGALYFGGFISAVSVIPYSIIFGLFLKLNSRFDLSNKMDKQNIIASFILSLPLVLTVFISTVIPTGSLPPSWNQGFELAALVLIAAWSAILISKLIIYSLTTQQRVAA
ncbi:MAG: hypothetical protein HUJ22_03425 [Gracilimonas sp.]|uniref:hypothetical protein n=1 Tax=Gracilimonas sp. TaxID=1974203 RepID=UPI0019895530|nr:hypothetical protein [Gracilimonas sp.]MBD3615599.1 hypothetical protein [Gracilimonas sp.]